MHCGRPIAYLSSLYSCLMDLQHSISRTFVSLSDFSIQPRSGLQSPLTDAACQFRFLESRANTILFAGLDGAALVIKIRVVLHVKKLSTKTWSVAFSARPTCIHAFEVANSRRTTKKYRHLASCLVDKLDCKLLCELSSACLLACLAD